MERLEKELATREAKLAEQAELISALRVDVSETALNAQVAIDDLREDLAVSAELLRTSQVIDTNQAYAAERFCSCGAAKVGKAASERTLQILHSFRVPHERFLCIKGRHCLHLLIHFPCIACLNQPAQQ